jgi:hypothetical protein
MLITRKSILTGVTRVLEFDITEEQFDKYLKGELAQVAFPHLSPAAREFIMTGVTSEEWDDLFGEENE